MADVVAMLKAEEKVLKKRLYALQQAIEALECAGSKPDKRTMSAATNILLKKPPVGALGSEFQVTTLRCVGTIGGRCIHSIGTNRTPELHSWCSGGSKGQQGHSRRHRNCA